MKESREETTRTDICAAVAVLSISLALGATMTGLHCFYVPGNQWPTQKGHACMQMGRVLISDNKRYEATLSSSASLSVRDKETGLDRLIVEGRSPLDGPFLVVMNQNALHFFSAKGGQTPFNAGACPSAGPADGALVLQDDGVLTIYSQGVRLHELDKNSVVHWQ